MEQEKPMIGADGSASPAVGDLNDEEAAALLAF
jgi:hypothetical protein